MHLYDAAKDRLVWIPAVIEADRDPCAKGGSGFWANWSMTREIGRGWFGTLGLPREVWVEDYAFLAPGPTTALRTPPLPELARLATGVPFAAATARLPPGAAVEAGLRGTSLRATARFTVPAAGAFDVGLVVLASDGDEERTRVGVRRGRLADTDLWDETNGDLATPRDATTVDACEAACDARADCAAWTRPAGRHDGDVPDFRPGVPDAIGSRDTDRPFENGR